VLLSHLLVLLLPLVTLLLEGLHLSLEVAGLDIGLAEPGNQTSVHLSYGLLRSGSVRRMGKGVESLR
jgi:hypothetical protein